MKKKESAFVLVSLEDEKAKKLASILSSGAARRILDALTENPRTESELARTLSMPLSTVHYNLRLLVEGGLVVTDAFHYSSKGREVAHYSLARKYIIIAPRNDEGMLSRLRHLLPALGITIGAAAFLSLQQAPAPVETFAAKAAPEAFAEPIADAQMMALTTAPTISPAVWFAAGAALCVLVIGASLLLWRKR